MTTEKDLDTMKVKDPVDELLEKASQQRSNLLERIKNSKNQRDEDNIITDLAQMSSSDDE